MLLRGGQASPSRELVSLLLWIFAPEEEDKNSALMANHSCHFHVLSVDELEEEALLAFIHLR